MKNAYRALIVLSILVTSSIAQATGNAGGFVGTWIAQRDGKQVATTKLLFSKAGLFRFSGSGWSSEGKFTFEPLSKTLLLVWTKVDGAVVKPGAMKKRILLAENGTFRIDQYLWSKNVVAKK